MNEFLTEMLAGIAAVKDSVDGLHALLEANAVAAGAQAAPGTSSEEGPAMEAAAAGGAPGASVTEGAAAEQSERLAGAAAREGSSDGIVSIKVSLGTAVEEGQESSRQSRKRGGSSAGDASLARRHRGEPAHPPAVPPPRLPHLQAVPPPALPRAMLDRLAGGPGQLAKVLAGDRPGEPRDVFGPDPREPEKVLRCRVPGGHAYPLAVGGMSMLMYALSRCFDHDEGPKHYVSADGWPSAYNSNCLHNALAPCLPIILLMNQKPQFLELFQAMVYHDHRAKLFGGCSDGQRHTLVGLDTNECEARWRAMFGAASDPPAQPPAKPTDQDLVRLMHDLLAPDVAEGGQQQQQQAGQLQRAEDAGGAQE